MEAAWLRGMVYEFQSDITFPANVPFLLIGCICELQKQADRMRQLQETAPDQRLRGSDPRPTPARQRSPAQGCQRPCNRLGAVVKRPSQTGGRWALPAGPSDPRGRAGVVSV